MYSYILFGVPGDVPVPTLLDACTEQHCIDHVVTEHDLAADRTLRWVALLGDDTVPPDLVLSALTHAMGRLVVVVGNDDGWWRVLSIRLDGSRLVETFERCNQSIPPEPFELQLERCSGPADVQAFDAEREQWQQWDHFERSERAGDAFQATPPVDTDDLPFALDWGDLYDWFPSRDGDDRPNISIELSQKQGDFARALALVDQELASLGETGSDQARSLALFNRACYLSRLGRIDDALAALTNAVRIGPEHFDDAWRDDDLESLRTDARFAPTINAAFERSAAATLAGALDQRLFVPVHDLEISVRMANGLASLGIQLVGDLVQKTVGDVGGQLGIRAANEILEVVNKLGMSLGTPIPHWQAARAWWRFRNHST